jgi:hypothetical protein
MNLRRAIGWALAAWPLAAHAAEPRVTALVGGTVIDVAQGGESTHDIDDSVVLLKRGLIAAVGTRASLPVPSGAEIVDVHGKFVMPGLVDGFTGMQNQGEANAELYEGVTTIGASGDDRRGTLFLAADPSPHVYVIDSAGSTDDWSLLRNDPAWRDKLADGNDPHELSPADTKAQIEEIARRGGRAIWVGHNITPTNAASIIAQAKALHIATYGEFVATPYERAIGAGVNVLLHTTRLELGLAPPDLLEKAAADPDGRGASPAYLAVDGVDPNDPAVTRYADLIATHRVALMPTFSLFYTLLPEHRNLWKEKAAALLNPKAMALTSDPATGEVAFPSVPVQASMTRTALHSFALDSVILHNHVSALAASGASWQGALPGISLHTELEMLVMAGLTPRQALAAATGNYAELLGWTELGAVEAGRRADLLVLGRDPRTDVRNADAIEAVYLSGEKVKR